MPEVLPPGTIRGVAAIAEFMGLTVEQVRYLDGAGRLPTFKVREDQTVCARRCDLVPLGTPYVAPLRGAAHPHSKPVMTPAGRFVSATEAGRAHGLTRRGAAQRAERRIFGWRYEDTTRS